MQKQKRKQYTRTFENDAFRQGIVETLAKRRSIEQASSESPGFNRQTEYDKLANVLRMHLDIPQIKALCHLT